MFSFIALMAGCHADAVDIVPEAFVKVRTRAARYRSQPGPPFARVARIVRRKAIDRIRSATRRHERIETLLRSHRDEADIPIAAGALVETERYNLVRSALERHGEREARAVGFDFFVGLAHGEIVVGPGIPVGTVTARIRRGLPKLRPVPGTLQAA